MYLAPSPLARRDIYGVGKKEARSRSFTPSRFGYFPPPVRVQVAPRFPVSTLVVYTADLNNETS